MSNNKNLSRGHLFLMLRVLCGAVVLCGSTANADEPVWRAVTPEELKQTSEPLAPGAPAVYLYYQYDRDDNSNREFIYSQIKVLKEEGRDYGTLQIAYDRRDESIKDLHARVIQPDGTIETFTGAVYEKPIASNSRVKQFAKALTLPNVRVGSIIEYQYVRDQPDSELFNTVWVLSQDLFTRQARYSLTPYRQLGLRWSWPRGMPVGTSAPKKEGKNLVTLETHNVPAFVSEPFMPPALSMKYRVEFVYSNEEKMETDADKFWQQVAKDRYKGIEAFLDTSANLKKKVESLTVATDSPQQKLRKLYAHVQQLRNITYEEQMTRQEELRNKDQRAQTVGDVLRHGYGRQYDLLWYFLALARTAGFEADPVLVGGRSRRIFSPASENPGQLDSAIVAVKLDGGTLYLDPSTPFLPFGVLHWSDTFVHAMKVTATGGEWFSTPPPTSATASALREGRLTLGDDGSLEGTLDITYSGYEAFWRRLDKWRDDATSRKAFLEDDLKDRFASVAEVTLLEQPDWTTTEAPLKVRYKVRIASWAVDSGKRTLLGVGLLGKLERSLFTRSEREHPVYFSYPTRTEDLLYIKLPDGWKVQSMPETRFVNDAFTGYTAQVDAQPQGFRIRRVVRNEAIMWDRKDYSGIQKFYQQIRSGDDEQVVIAH